MEADYLMPDYYYREATDPENCVVCGVYCGRSFYCGTACEAMNESEYFEPNWAPEMSTEHTKS